MTKSIETLTVPSTVPSTEPFVSTRSATHDDGKLTALAHEAIYDTVLEIVSNVPAERILDVPAGEGALAARLLQRGFNVRCCDLYPEIFRLAGVEIRGGDLASRLDYEDNSFDTVICVEGLEHTENPQQAIREFSRLLTSGGNLIVSVPNILNIEERVKWLLYGYTSHFKPLSSSYLAKQVRDYPDRPEIALHINPISYSELRYSLEKCGFKVVRVYRDKRKSNLWLYWPFVAFIRLLNLLTPKSKRRERWSDELQSDQILLGGNTLIIHAEKN